MAKQRGRRKRTKQNIKDKIDALQAWKQQMNYESEKNKDGNYCI
jgi:hypothetical protein